MNIIEQLFNDFGTKHLEEAKKNGVDLGLQTVYTPIDKIEKATGIRFADYITSETHSVAVLFNTEFIGYFIKELPQNYINNIKFTFFYDCEFDYKQVRNFILFSGKRLNVDFVKIENIKDLDKVMAGKKFDIVFSNPPYSNHLKIMDTFYKVSTSMIWVSPTRWCEDPLTRFGWKERGDWKNFNHLVKNLQFFKTISALDAYNTFGINLKSDLGFYYIDKSKNSKVNFDSYIFSDGKNFKIVKSIYEKIRANVNEFLGFNCVEYSKRTTGNFVTIAFQGGTKQRGNNAALHSYLRSPIYGPFAMEKFNGKTLEEIKSENKLSVWGNVEKWPVICFNTEKETINFYNSSNLKFISFLTWALASDQSVPLNFIPVMIEETNPRTGLKGYEGEWTNEDFYQFFGITEEEQKYIEETMSQFK